MEQLWQMAGVWKVVTGIFVSGVLDEGPPTRAEITRAVGAKMLIEHGVYEAAGRRFEPVNVYSFDPFRQLYRVASLDDTAGLMDIYEGRFSDGCLRLTNERAQTWFRRPDGAEVKFRVTYCFEPDRMVVDIAEADPHEEEWKAFMRIRYERESPGS